MVIPAVDSPSGRRFAVDSDDRISPSAVTSAIPLNDWGCAIYLVQFLVDVVLLLVLIGLLRYDWR